MMAAAYVAFLLAACIAACEAGQHRTALMVVDMQPCFMPGGSLGVPHAERTLDIVQQLAEHGPYELIAFSLDCHPPGHISFASTHNSKPQQEIQLVYNRQGQLCNMQHLFPPPMSVMCDDDQLQLATPARQPSANSISKGHVDDSVADQGTIDQENKRDGLIIVKQTLWPAHCERGTDEAQLHPQLAKLLQPIDESSSPVNEICDHQGIAAGTHYQVSDDQTTLQCCQSDHIILHYNSLRANNKNSISAIAVVKGTQKHMDAYSAFYGNGHLTHTGLHAALQAHGITHLHVVGLALDVCVAATAQDAAALGYHTTLLQDASQPVSEEGKAATFKRCSELGIHIANSKDVLEQNYKEEL